MYPDVIDNPVDQYSSAEYFYENGENGDFTGSPYGYVTEDSPAASVQTMAPAATNTPAPATTQVATNEKKPWYDVVAQLISTGAGAYAAVKTADSGQGVYNPATGQYQPAVQKQPFNSWGLVILAVVAVIVLWYFIATNNKK